MTGYTVNGGYAEYVLADPGYVGHLPANVGFAEIAPILCAGVTVYKGLKVLDCKPGDWVAISGIGGLGHFAVQYAKAMGFHVIGGRHRRRQARAGEDAWAPTWWSTQRTADPAAGTAARDSAARTACSSPPSRAPPSRRRWACCTSAARCRWSGLPPGDFALPIFDVVLNAKTVRGSIVGTRKDLQEALAFAGEGKVATPLQRRPHREHQPDLRPHAQGRDRGPDRPGHGGIAPAPRGLAWRCPVIPPGSRGCARAIISSSLVGITQAAHAAAAAC